MTGIFVVAWLCVMAAAGFFGLAWLNHPSHPRRQRVERERSRLSLSEWNVMGVDARGVDGAIAAATAKYVTGVISVETFELMVGSILNRSQASMRTRRMRTGVAWAQPEVIPLASHFPMPEMESVLMMDGYGGEYDCSGVGFMPGSHYPLLRAYAPDRTCW